MPPAKNPSADADTTGREVVITRLIRAPRELVFEAWTDPRHADKWMGPDGFTTITKSMDFRVGGSWRFVMSHATQGTFPNRVVYLEIVRPERLVYEHSSDSDDASDGFHVTVTFEALGERTHVTMRSVFQSVEARNKVVREYGAIEGGYQTLGRLEQLLLSQARS